MLLAQSRRNQVPELSNWLQYALYSVTRTGVHAALLATFWLEAPTHIYRTFDLRISRQRAVRAVYHCWGPDIVRRSLPITAMYLMRFVLFVWTLNPLLCSTESVTMHCGCMAF